MSKDKELIALQTSVGKLIVNFLTNVKKAGKSAQSAGFIEGRIKLLDSYWTQYTENHFKLVTLSETIDCSDYFESDNFSEVELKYSTALGELIDLNQKVPAPVNPDIANSAATTTTTVNKTEFKLPRITIPQFSGEYQSWASFRDLFVSVVHNEKSISPSQKLHYLKSNLTGEAAQLLRTIQVTDANYQSAWELLNKRYQNTRAITTHYIKTLVSQSPVGSVCSKDLKQLLDTTNECIQSLQNLRLESDYRDAIVVYLVVQKLDTKSQELWEQSLNGSAEYPTLNELTEFIEARFRTVEIFESEHHPLKSKENKSVSGYTNNTRRLPPTKATNAFHATHDKSKKPKTFSKCPCKCSFFHRLYMCKVFKGLPVIERLQIVRDNLICTNCFSVKHKLNECTSERRCYFCNEKHHSLLHEHHSTVVKPPINAESRQVQSQATTSQSNSYGTTSCHTNVIQTFLKPVLLATALVNITASDGTRLTFRALIDQGSQATFISERAANRLKLRRTSTLIPVNGLNSTIASTARYIVNLNITSIYDPMEIIKTEALILKSITGLIPSGQVSSQSWTHLHGLTLADPNFNKPAKIDILLGAGVYSRIIMDDIIKGVFCNRGVLSAAWVGWIISGQVEILPHSNESGISSYHAHLDIGEQLRKFWELEDIGSVRQATKQEVECESYYEQTHSRGADGRYTVNLPFVANASHQLGTSREFAVKQLMQVEKRFIGNPRLDMDYKRFMQEYIELGHMRKTSIAQSSNSIEVAETQTKPLYESFYLPHHAVLKEASTTTKLRVVFNASRKSSNGKSLNDLLEVGPTLQQDLSDILIRWRKYKIGFSADITKMYRQVRVVDEHTEYQRIVWRNTRDDPIQDYKLLTVTYGTASAPYLAVKTLRQLALDEQNRYPNASSIALTDFYVDDLLSGTDTLSDAIQLQQELTAMLISGGFELRKWASNCVPLVQTIHKSLREVKVEKGMVFDDTIKTLGINWHPSTDQFQFKVHLPDPLEIITKRKFLSDVAKLFDPLGWLAPTVIIAKIMFQELWLEGVGWDEQLPLEIERKWKEYRGTLSTIEAISIPRWLGTINNKSDIELHGFSDASMKAYAAAVYLRTKNADGDYIVTLVVAKTRVAPIKQVTLPRLELCGAVMLAKLLAKVNRALLIPKLSIFAYTDSMIVLAWLNGNPNKWKSFVANRVTTILENLDPSQWNHIRSEENPADCATRGINPLDLKHNMLWWNGPNWLKMPSEMWPQRSQPSNADELNMELRPITVFSTQIDPTLQEWLMKYSSYSKLIRITAYCQRFGNNARRQTDRSIGCLKADELRSAEEKWIKIVQQQSYEKEIRLLQGNKPINCKSAILPLSPFICDRGFLRVGGRLKNSLLPVSAKYPILLPHHSNFSKLIILKAHMETLHGGIQATLFKVRTIYWIPNAKTTVRRIIHRCVKCHRFSAATNKQLMAALPAPRVTPSRIFAHTGVDFAGPFNLRLSKHRGKGTTKGYVAMFICLVSKALHIELVGDLSSESFIAAFRRFTARRGLCTDMYSDCGTNFVGASKELNVLHKLMTKEVEPVLANDTIKWHFIPPGSPHFGGIWEASVKSLKYHLRRVVGSVLLTYEEFTTVLSQIEAALNSRPLSMMSSDPNDIQPLTPGHFVIGQPLNAVPEPSLLNLRENRLNRWQLMQKLVQDLWKQWSREYLAGLQQRPRKWSKKFPNISVGTVVLIKDEQLPPLKWALARVEEVHPGPDNLVRVCTVRYNGKKIKRPIVKLCPLPIIDNETVEESL